MPSARSKAGEPPAKRRGRPRRRTPDDGRTLTERVADNLVAYILEEGLQDGAMLPASADLAERYGVSRTVVREAIADLAGRGILRRGQGRETLVVSPGQEQLGGLLLFRTLHDGVSSEEVQETRRAIESITSGLAAARRTDEHLGQLERALEDMRAATTDAEFHDADVSFHNVLARASQNRLILLVFEGIEALVREVRLRATMGRRLRGESFDSVIAAHQAIYDAVARRDPREAETAMLIHLRQTEEGLSALRETATGDDA
ncbi:MAG TPA: FadR/GntR family transcriptional regulator [Gaiellaceae bacterium]|nr:FadR/GntR family transcriptional regulator [Gaiellaceae bacterium]